MTRSLLPVISIITPSYNQAEYLEECIDSVLGQGYANLEYLIMDGGSTDGSVEIIKKYEKYLTYWQSGPDGGQYRAISEGFRRTSGEIMAWINSDDKYHPLAFAKVAAFFAENPGTRWLTGRKSFWDAAGNILRIEDTLPVFSRRKFLEGHFNKPYIQQESTFWRRSLWEQAGGFLDGSLALAGDLELWCRFFRFAPIDTADTLLGGYRFHAGQRGIEHADLYLREALSVIDRERAYLNDAVGNGCPPAPLSLKRDTVADVVRKSGVTPMVPNRFGCWCEYTEDLSAILAALLEERRGDLFPFWHNEISALTLIKPRASLLFARLLDGLSSCWQRQRQLTGMGENKAVSGDTREALRCFQDAYQLNPAWPSAGATLLDFLWGQGMKAESLGLIPELLKRHSHDGVVVTRVASVLAECGAKEQARGVCDEYLMVDPHHEGIGALRKELARC